MRWVACGLVFAALLGALAEPSQAAEPSALPAPNPWAAAGPYPMSHHNPAQTDVSIVEGPTRGKRLEASEAKTVPVVWCSAPIVKRVGGHTTVIAGTPHGLAKIDATGEAFDFVSFMPYPEIEEEHADVTPDDIARHRQGIDAKRRLRQDLRLLLRSAWMLWDLELNMRNGGSGAYGVIDKDGYHYTAYDSIRLVKSFDRNERLAPLVPVRHASVTDGLPGAEAHGIDRIMGISMTYDGHLVAAATGALFVLDRELDRKDHLLFPGEHVENTIAVDERSIYLVTSKYMRRIIWTGERLSTDEADGAWKSAYDVMPEGEAIRRGAASHGSGTTPTLLGFGNDEDKLVVISDGSQDGAQLVAFWRDEIPADFVKKPGTRSRRIADQIRLRLSPMTVEASPVVYGNGVLVLNSTYPDSPPPPLSIIGNAFLSGVTRKAPLGAQKFEWDPEENRFAESWFLPEIDNTDWMPPAVSPQNGLAYLAHKVNGTYEYRAIDWETGELVARWIFPDDSVLWNNWGGITTLLEDGDLLLGGFFAVKRYDIGHLR
ncbi:MAG: hypothetical protein OEO79_17260 [Gemmatimonadota bacterium]|nr:hypothetical protein [Gemmatimonadota bacterium]